MLVNVARFARFVRAVEHPHKLFSWFKVSIGRLTQVMRLGCILLLASLFTTSHAEDSASVTAIGNDIQRQWELGFARVYLIYFHVSCRGPHLVDLATLQTSAKWPVGNER